MSSTIAMIANPAARSGRLGADVRRMHAMAQDVLGPVDLFLTEGPRHAEQLARTLPNTVHTVIGVGGDGTLNEVAAGLCDSGRSIRLGIIPAGSGNDLARVLHLSLDPMDALRTIRNGVPLRMDSGTVEWRDANGAGKRRFVNACGIGLDAFAAWYAPRWKHLPFGMGYTVAVLVALARWIPVGATIRSADGTVLHAGPLMFTTVGNAKDSGGGFRLNPRALVADGLLDACIARGMRRSRALNMLPKARTGAHLEAPEVGYHQLEGLVVEVDRGVPIHADGEMCTLEGRDIRVAVDTGSVTVLVDADRMDRILQS
jgi:YegS/Rv2252/BmrU family lipid kinase